MNDEIEELLEEMGLKSTEKSIEPSSLENSFYQYKGKIKRSKQYTPPSFGDIHALKEKACISTSDIAKFCMVISKTAMKWTSPSYHENKKYIPSSVWLALVEAAGMKEKSLLTPRQPDIRIEIFETHTSPSKHELWQLYAMSLMSKQEIAKATGINEKKLSDNFKRGKIPYDSFSFIDKSSSSKLETETSDLTFDEWRKLKSVICPQKRTHPPLIREACISKNTQFDIYAHKRESKVTVSKSTNKASFQIRKSMPLYLDTDAIYSPPNKREVRAILVFLGISFHEAAIVMGCSFNRINRFIDGEIKPSYYEWRRLLEVFQLSSHREI